MMSLIVLNPKRTILGRNHVIWAINRENRSRGSSWVCEREKKDRAGKKLQKGYISPICGEAPTEAMYMKICVVGDVLDVITCAKFQNEIFRGYNVTGGRIFHFPIDFKWAFQQCIISTALGVPKRFFAVLYVSVMGLTRCYKTTVFFTFIGTSGDREPWVMDLMEQKILAKKGTCLAARERRQPHNDNKARYTIPVFTAHEHVS